MGRIRSIKPEFFTSETITALPLSARLTFIGLWTYVDDNGVGLDNEMLINAAIWPLEEDSLETLGRTREDLATLSRASLVTRYRDSRKRYLAVNSWDEHQKVDHPRKPRYPKPDADGCEPIVTCEDTDSREVFARVSREDREDLAPEQGSGIRDQGAGIREQTLGQQADRESEPDLETVVASGQHGNANGGGDSRNRLAGSDEDPLFVAFWSVYPRRTAKVAARKAWKTVVVSRRVDPQAIIAGAERYRDDPRRNRSDPSFTAHPSTWLNGERWNDYDEKPQAAAAPQVAWWNA